MMSNVTVLPAGGARQGDPRGQPGRRGVVPPGHRASSGECRGLLIQYYYDNKEYLTTILLLL